MLRYYVIIVMPAVAIVGALIYLPFYLINRRRLGKRPLARHLTLLALICCLLSLAYLTVLWYYPDITFSPSWHLLNLRPFLWLTETYEMGAGKMVRQLLLNIAMFVPLGLLLPMAARGLRRLHKTGLVVLATTLSIETLQYFMGRSADIDDVIMNLAGGLLGYALFFGLNRAFGQRAWWRAALSEGGADSPNASPDGEG